MRVRLIQNAILWSIDGANVLNTTRGSKYICCMQGAQSRGRKKAQLEDINPVFQTETWRKLE